MIRFSPLRYLLIFACILLTQSALAQSEDHYWVLLSDKDNTPFSVSTPADFLSERAITRRVNQNIAVDLRDLPVDPDYIAQVQNVEGVELRYASRWFNALAIRCDSLTMLDVAALSFVSQVKSSPRLNSMLKETIETSTIIDGRPTINSRLPIDYGQSANQITDMNGQFLHELDFEGQGMVIALLDSGFDNVDSMAAFTALRNEGRILSTKDFVEGDLEVYDEHGHGRSVLSTIAGIQEGEAYGSAVQASFHLLRTEDVASETPAEEFNWIAAAEYADSIGADLLNTSLGYTTFDDSTDSYTYEDMNGDATWITQGADIAASRGMLVVNSAGNSGSSSWHYIGAPADGDSVLAIGAVDPDSSHTSFSSFGPSFDGRVKPNVCAQGRQAIGINRNDEVVAINGTSFSSPILCGLAACLWQSVPEATNMQVFAAIEMSAHLFNEPNDSLGFGIPNFGLANFILQDAVSLSETEKESQLLLFPNPMQDRFTMILTDTEFGIQPRILVMNSMGQEVTVPLTILSSSHYSFDTSGLSRGLYVISVSLDGAFFQQTMVKY